MFLGIEGPDGSQGLNIVPEAETIQHFTKMRYLHHDTPSMADQVRQVSTEPGYVDVGSLKPAIAL